MAILPLYRVILRQALQITNRYKTIWILGFFATFLGLGGEWQFLFNQYLSFSDGGYADIAGISNLTRPEIWQMIGAALAALPVWAYLIILFFFSLVLFGLWFLTAAQGGLVLAVERASSGRGRVSIVKSFKDASRSFWSLLGIVISTRLISVLLMAVIGLPLLAVIVALDESLAALAGTLIFFILCLPVIIVFSLIGRLAVSACLIEGARWRESLARSLRLFSGHWLVCLELAFILLIISLLAAVLFVPVAGLLSLPFLFFGVVMLKVSAAFFYVFLIVAAILFFALLLFLSSWLGAYISAVWTMLYLKIKITPAQSKLVRILHNWREKYGS